MSGLPLASRVVEVIADLGEATHPRYRYGSGCVVAGRTVLTAAHVVKGAVSVKVRNSDKVIFEAALDPRFVGDVDGPRPDLALVELTGPEVDVPAMGLAAVDRDSVSADPVEGCHAVGYPIFMERDAPDGGRVRETADAFGYVPVLSGLAGGLLSVQVTSAPRPLPPGDSALAQSQWSGMSGGPVVAGGLLLGVVTEHALRAGDSTITATPLTALEADPAHPGRGSGVADPGTWWARLGCSGSNALRLLPAEQLRAEPDYWATVREIHQRTGTLIGRQDELAEIAFFVAGPEGYRWLAAGAWAGKTSLLAGAAVAMLGDECDVVCYFLSRRAADADSPGFLAAVVPQLAHLLGEDPRVRDSHQYWALWQRAAQRAEAEDRPLLLVVDGLDEDLRPHGLRSVAELLPSRAGGRVHVLVSSRSHLDLRRDLPAGHTLAATKPVTMRPFEGADELATLAFQELNALICRDDGGLAADALGLLTAAAGPLAVNDLAAMSAVAPQSAALTRRIRRLVTSEAARSLQPTGLAKGDRYQFAHGSLLEQAQENEDLTDPDFLRRIHQWADSWRAAGWPPADGSGEGTPNYLLDTYPSTLTEDPQRLAALVSDARWVDAAVQSVGVDRVLADLARAAAADPASAAVAAMLATVRGQAHNLRPPQPIGQRGYVLRQLCLQALELCEDDLADEIRARLRSLPGLRIVPEWTTRRTNAALLAEFGLGHDLVEALVVLPDGQMVAGDDEGRVRLWDPSTPHRGPVELGLHDGSVSALAALPDGRVVSIGGGRMRLWRPGSSGYVLEFDDDSRSSAVAALPDGRVITGGDKLRLWDPRAPAGGPVTIGLHRWWLTAVAVLLDGRVVTGSVDGQMQIWDLAAPGAAPIELGYQNDMVTALGVLADGRVVSSSRDGQIRLWDPSVPGDGSVELGRHDDYVSAVAVLPDGQVVTGGHDGRVRLWDPSTPHRGPVELGLHDGSVYALAALADGRMVSSGSYGRIMLWDPSVGRVGQALPGYYHIEVRSLAVLPDGRVVTSEGDGRVRVWDPGLPEANPVELSSHDEHVREVAALPDGTVVSGGSDGRVLVWDPRAPGVSPVELGRHGGHVSAVAALPDGRVVSGDGGSDGAVWLWEPKTPRASPIDLGVHDAVRAVAVLPDGRVVSGGLDGQVRVSDPKAHGAAPVHIGRHEGPVHALAALGDGRVISGGAFDDPRVLVWDPKAPGTAPIELGRHHLVVYSVLAVPDGRIITSGADNQVQVWKIPSAAANPLASIACVVGRLATATSGSNGAFDVVMMHRGRGLSAWSIR